MKRSIAFVLSLGLLLFAAGSSVGCQPDNQAKFGAVLPLTGSIGAYGTAIKRGIEIAAEQAKADAAYPYEIEVTYVDSEGDPDKAAGLLAERYDAGALAVIGGVTSAEALAMVEVADEQDRVLVSPSASSPDLTGVSRNFFRVFPSDFVEGTKMGTFAANNLKLETIAIVASEATYGQGIQGVFESEFERHGGEVVEVIAVPPGTLDFSGVIGRIMTLDPQAVYLAAYWDDIVKLIQALKDSGFEGRILTTAAFATPQAVDKAGEAAEGVYFTQTVFDLDSPDPSVRDFVETYRAQYGEDPDLYTAHGYDAMRVLLTALQEAGSTLPSNFWKGMRAIRNFPGATGTIQFDEKGDVQKFPRVYVIKDGAPQNYEEHVRQVREAFRARLRELEEQRRRLRGQ